MRNGWRLATVGEVCEIVNGGTPKTNIADYWGGHHLWITPAEMGKRISPYVADTARKLTDPGLGDCSARLLPPLSVILSSRAPIGHLVINTDSMATNQGCKGLIPNKSLDHKFLFYYLSSIVDLLNDLGTGTTFNELSGGKLKEVRLPLPTLPEQKRIVVILDEAFAGVDTVIANAERSLANARKVFDNYREFAFKAAGPKWVVKPLTDLCYIKHGFAFKSEYFSGRGEHVLLTPGNFYEMGGYRDRGEKQKYYCGETPDGFILSPGDLLVAMTEQAAGLLGSPVLIPESGTFLHNQRLGLVTKKPGVKWLNEFFFHLFNTQAVRTAIHDSATGLKVRHTSPTKIGEVLVSFPESISEQLNIVKGLNDMAAETQRLEANYRRKLSSLSELRQAILHKAFAGELTTCALEATQEAAE